jgi:hypothetical protein
MGTPADKQEALKKIVDKIEGSDIAVFGVMDYWTFGGYLALRDYLGAKSTSSPRATAARPGWA